MDQEEELFNSFLQTASFFWTTSLELHLSCCYHQCYQIFFSFRWPAHSLSRGIAVFHCWILLHLLYLHLCEAMIVGYCFRNWFHPLPLHLLHHLLDGHPIFRNQIFVTRLLIVLDDSYRRTPLLSNIMFDNYCVFVSYLVKEVLTLHKSYVSTIYHHAGESRITFFVSLYNLLHSEDFNEVNITFPSWRWSDAKWLTS